MLVAGITCSSSAEDAQSAEHMTALLTALGFLVQQYRIPVGGDWTPTGDVVALCGPKSSSVTARAIDRDPALSFEPDADGRWVIRDRVTGVGYESGIDATPSIPRDMAYVARLPHGENAMLVVAVVHAIGSLGAIHYLAGHAREIYDQVGDGCWSSVIASTHDGDTILTSEPACPIHRH